MVFNPLLPSGFFLVLWISFFFVLAIVVWDFPGIVLAEEPEWKDSIHGSNAVVNLAGMPISTRWSPEVSVSSLFDCLVCAAHATCKR